MRKITWSESDSAARFHSEMTRRFEVGFILLCNRTAVIEHRRGPCIEAINAMLTCSGRRALTALANLRGIDCIRVGRDWVSVQMSDSADWSEVQPHVLQALQATVFNDGPQATVVQRMVPARARTRRQLATVECD